MDKQEIKCPKCGEVFVVDGSGYSAIVKQVRDKEFEKELDMREKQILFNIFYRDIDSVVTLQIYE